MIKKIIQKLGTLLFLTGLLALSACGGGGGGGGGGGSGPLNGTWGGTIEDPSGNLGVITATINGSSITVTTIGIPSARSIGGTISLNQGKIWDVLLNDGTEAGFIHDASVTHAAFLDEFFSFGVVQKGASGPSTYSGPDVVGTWSGEFVTLDANFFLATTGTASATVNADTTFTGSSSAPDTFSGTIPNFNSSFGVWTGSISSATSGSGVVEVFLTNDKSFAGSYSCFPSFPAFPDGCAFNMWNRQ